jgi:hypothetical protein
LVDTPTVDIPDSLSEIYCYCLISTLIATSGKPTLRQFQAIAAKCFEVFINLGLKDTDHALPDEQEQVESLGLIYECIPVL